MITLHVESIDCQQQIRSFHCYLESLNTALDTLNLIAATGNQLVDAYVLEDGHRTSLPLQAFDGRDIEEPLRALQREWEALLSSAPACYIAGVTASLFILVKQRIQRYETIMAGYNRTNVHLEGLIGEAQLQLKEGPWKDRLITRYRTLITRHQTYIDMAMAGRTQCLHKLSDLK